MKNTKSKNLTYGAMIAALYVVLTHLQNFLLPDTTSLAIQFRASEALCVLAFFTPAGIWGLTAGCLLFNLSYAALPADVVLGTLATFLATGGMYLLRRVKVGKVPFLGLLLPGIFNGILVGAGLTIHGLGFGFFYNALCVALGEMAVLLTLGTGLYFLIQRRDIKGRIF